MRLTPIIITFFVLIGNYFTKEFCPRNPDLEWKKFHLSGNAQGTTWSIIYFSRDSLVTKGQVDSLLNSLDSSLSIYKPYSQISRFNKSFGGLKIGTHLTTVVRKSLETYGKTNGLFDITMQPLVEAWGFSAKKVEHYPDSAKVKQLLQCIGSDQLELNGNFLRKKKSCVKIDVDGIAQGYSVDVLANFLEAHDTRNYIVELGGEIRVKGRKLPGNDKMKIGIEAPGNYEMEEPSIIQKIIEVDSGGITTSGSYRKFHESQGRKFSHTIDPHTGFPIQNELISVTVFAPDAITADAYDNVFMAMGLKKSIEFLGARNDLAAYFIFRTQSGEIRDSGTIGFRKFIQP